MAEIWLLPPLMKFLIPSYGPNPVTASHSLSKDHISKYPTGCGHQNIGLVDTNIWPLEAPPWVSLYYCMVGALGDLESSMLHPTPPSIQPPT